MNRIVSTVLLIVGIWYLTPNTSENSFKDRKLNRNKETTGIKRVGVTCYLNTVLQVLNTSDKFIFYLKNAYMHIKVLDSIRAYNKHDDVYKLHVFLFDVISRLQDGNKSICINIKEIRQLETIMGITLLQQNDWLEILEKLVDVLERERKILASCLKNYQKSEHYVNIQQQITKSDQLLQLPFYGMLAIKSYCSSCKKKQRPRKNETQSEKILSLMIDMTQIDSTNNSFEKAFTKSFYENIEAYNCSYCSLSFLVERNKNIDPTLKRRFDNDDIFINDEIKLKNDQIIKTNLVRMSKFTKYPDILIVSLNRFKWTYNQQFLRVHDVYTDFPKILYLHGHKYKLINLVKHSGGVRTGGHYQVFRRKPTLIKNKYTNIKTKKLELIDYDLKNRIDMQKKQKNVDDSMKLNSSLEFDPSEKDLNDFFLINDEKSKQTSLLYDINPNHSNSITGVVYELVY
ncbi:hypothetical protein QEN19_001943 [Hanseniaspora menglaensis]